MSRKISRSLEYSCISWAQNPVKGNACIFIAGSTPVTIQIGRFQWPRGQRVGLRPSACWDCELESRRVMDVCRQSCVLSGRGLCSGWSLVQWSPMDCGVSESEVWASQRRPLPSRGCRTMKKLLKNKYLVSWFLQYWNLVPPECLREQPKQEVTD